MTRPRYYILAEDRQTPVPVEMMEWAKWFENHNLERVVEQTNLSDIIAAKVMVSTVFLGLDHQYAEDGPPLLFETMVFGGLLDSEQWRYSTWDEAKAGHAAMVERVKAAEP